MKKGEGIMKTMHVGNICFFLVGGKQNTHTGNSLRTTLVLVIVQKVYSEEKKHGWALPLLYSAILFRAVLCL